MSAEEVVRDAVTNGSDEVLGATVGDRELDMPGSGSGTAAVGSVLELGREAAEEYERGKGGAEILSGEQYLRTQGLSEEAATRWGSVLDQHEPGKTQEGHNALDAEQSLLNHKAFEALVDGSAGSEVYDQFHPAFTLNGEPLVAKNPPVEGPPAAPPAQAS